jgi:hypothetical protein
VLMEELHSHSDDTVEIVISSSIKDIEIAKKDANDLAWEHSTEFAKATGVSLGSEEFEQLFRTLSIQYETNTNHLKYFLTTAILTVRELLESESLALPHSTDKITSDEVLELITSAARVLMASYVWIAGGQAISWPTNDELPETVNIPFIFDKDEIIVIDREV